MESEKYVSTCPKEYACPKNLLVKVGTSSLKELRHLIDLCNEYFTAENRHTHP